MVSNCVLKQNLIGQKLMLVIITMLFYNFIEFQAKN